MANDLDLINEADAAAPEAHFTNYGKFDWSIARYVVWQDGSPSEVSADEYAKAPLKKDGKTAKNVELLLTVDIQEFKPNLPFSYERKITIGGLDWNQTFKPGLEKAVGVKIAKGAASGKEVSVTDALNRAKGKYISYQDVPQKKEAKDGKTYNTMKPVRVFNTREECVAAMEGKATPASNSNGLTFDANMIAVFKKAAGKGKDAATIVKEYVDDEIVSKHGQAAVVAAVEQALA